MPPGITLQITVDDKGTPVVRQFSQGVQDAQQKIGANTESTKQATTATTAYGSSLAIGAKQAAGFGLAVLGLQGGVAVIQRIGDAFTSFQNALANVNTLIPGQVALQQSLRAEILQLPSALGSATDLANGLYQALSAGVEPAKAVAFVGDAARLARAGLADMDTSITALTKTMEVYGLGAEDAGRISDIFFQVVNVGQGTLKQFAGAFPDILVAGKALGVSLTDNAAALATLSAAFKSPDQAATGLVSLFSQLTQNADEFLKRGLDIRAIIAEQGLAGAIDALRNVTGGTSTTLQKFVGDIQGQQAALTLMNSQYNKYLENAKKVQEQSNPTRKAFAEQQKTVSAAASELANSFQKVIASDFANYVGENVAGGMRVLAKATSELATVLNNTGDEADQLAKKLNIEATAATAGFNGEITKAVQTVDKARESMARLGIETKKSIADGAVLALRDFDVALKSNEGTARGYVESFGKVLEQLVKAELPKLPAGFADITSTIEALARRNGIELTESYRDNIQAILQNARRGIQGTSADIVKVIEDGHTYLVTVNGRTAENFNETLRGEADETKKHFSNTTDSNVQIVEEGGKRLLTNVAVTAEIGAEHIASGFTKGFATIPLTLKKVQTDFDVTFDTITAKQVEFGNNFVSQLDETQRESALQFGLISRSALQMSSEVKRGLDLATVELNQFGNEVAKTSSETQRLLDLQISINTPFSKTLEGLTKQLDEVQKHMALVANGFFGFDLAGREFILNEDRKIIAEIEKRIALLRADQSTAPTSTTPTAPRFPGATITSPGGGGGLSPGGGGIFFPPAGGGGGPLNPGGGILRNTPDSLIQLPPGILELLFGGGAGSPFLGPGGPVPDFRRGPITIPPPRASSTGAQILSGPSTTHLPAETPQRAGSQTVASGTLAGPSFNININTTAITRQGAQELVDHLAPALREAARRGLLAIG